mmetsp:Transcript_20672/g.39291  ORF Transcript_20672/g.39291 Transcript_20672/m.39291 type:complete len:206 (-) Transcript_20672:173-790(-)|eukprot:scaffold1600_cov179-Amphora_coffeaeformis.AAC.4
MGNDASKPSDSVQLTPNSEKKRRIVKAVKPTKQTETKPSIVMPVPDLDKEEKEDSPSAEQVKLTVKTTVQPKTKAKREQKLQKHRLTPKSAASTAETKQPATPVVTPNPMSRFLSAFSVEPKHPEHKRRATEGIADPDTPKPSEKRLRAQDDVDVGDAAEHEDGITTRGSSLTTSSSSVTILLSTAALVVAVVATVWWRSTSKKR